MPYTVYINICFTSVGGIEIKLVLNAEQQSLVTALLVDHLWNKVKMCMYHGNKSSNELEIFEVVWVDGRGRVDLQTVVVFTRIFKKTVHGVQNFMRQQEKPFPVMTDRQLFLLQLASIVYFIYILLITGLV